MKHRFWLFACLISACSAYAQPVVGPFTPNLSDVHAKVITSGIPSAGDAGAQLSWDFSAVDFSSGVPLTKNTLTQTLQLSGNFLPATAPDGVDSTAYNELLLLQEAMPALLGEALLSAENPLVSLTQAMSYNQVVYDSYQEKYPSDVYTLYANGGSFYKYDAYGTLKTVYGTYYNVVRMLSSEADTITVDYGFGTFQAVSYYSTYTWIQPGSSTPLFTIMEARIFSQNDNIRNSSMTAAVLYEPSVATSVVHSSPGIALTVSPNPASDLVMIDFADLESGMYEITVLNTDGTLQHTEKFYAAKGSVYPVNISAYSSGMYVLHLNTPAGMGSKKFVKI